MTIRATLVLLVWLHVAAVYEARPDAQPSKVEVCHYDDALQKYTLMQTTVSGWQSGHAKHGKDCCIYDQVDVCPTSRRCDAPGAAIVMSIDTTAKTCTPICASDPPLAALANGVFSCISTAVGKSCVGGCSFGYAGQPAATCTADGTYSIVGTCEPAPGVDGCNPPTGNPCSGCDTVTNSGAIVSTCADDTGLGPGFTCTCSTGYTLDATTKCCKDTDECSGNPCSIVANSACRGVPAPGTGHACVCPGGSCVCPDGFTLAKDGSCVVPISGTIGLYVDGYYCTDGDYVVCLTGTIGGAEMFSVVVVGPNKVALRGGNRHLYCEEADNYFLNCDQSVLDSPEKFQVEYLGGDQIALRGGRSGYYCGKFYGYVACHSSVVGDSQRFHVVRIS